jgi:hypothetical protein
MRCAALLSVLAPRLARPGRRFSTWGTASARVTTTFSMLAVSLGLSPRCDGPGARCSQALNRRRRAELVKLVKAEMPARHAYDWAALKKPPSTKTNFHRLHRRPECR